MTTPIVEPTVSLKEAAALLGCSVKTLQNRIYLGTLQELRPHFILGRWRFPVAAIQALYAAGDTQGGRAPKLRVVKR